MHVCGLLSALFSIGFVERALGAPVEVYFNDFDGGKAVLPGVTDNLSGVGSPTGVQGFAGLGTGANVFAGSMLQNAGSGNPAPPTTLTLTDLPAHSAVRVEFLLALIDSWDGQAGNVAGPDVMNVLVDGSPFLSETFANDLRPQSYVAPPGVQLAVAQQLGFIGGDFKEAAYNMGLDPRFQNIPHASSTLTLSWFASGGGWQGGSDESFALDNLRVMLTVPEPSTLLLTLVGCLSLLCRFRSAFSSRSR